MNPLRRILNQTLFWLEKALEWIVIFAVAALAAAVLWQVLTRFLSDHVEFIEPSRWTEEFARLLLIWVSLLGAAVAFRRREHLGVDYFVSKLEPDARRLMEVIVELVVVAFAAVAMVYGGYVLVTETLAASQLTPAMGLKMGYVYLAVPISGLFIIAFSLQHLAELCAPTHDDLDLGGEQGGSPRTTEFPET